MDIKEKIAYGKTDRKLVMAKDIQQTHLFYSEWICEGDRGEQAKRKHFSDVAKLLTPEKTQRYKDTFKNDLPAFLADVLLEYKRVHNAHDRHIEVKFGTPQLTEDFEVHRRKVVKDEAFFKDSTAAVLENPNGIVVVSPNGKLRMVDTSAICYYSPEHLIYKADGDSYVSVTVEGWEVYEEVKGDYVLVESEPNPTDKIPFKLFWNDKKGGSDFLALSPIYNSFPKFHRFLLHENGRDYFEMYAKYPILKRRKIKCTYTDPSGVECENGVIERYNEYTNEPVRTECPSCKASKFLGAGSEIEVPMDYEAGSNNWNAVDFVNSDPSVLNYNAQRTQELMAELTHALIGVGADGVRNKAVNERQIEALYEKKNAILNSLARNFEVIHKWVLEVTAALFYPTLSDDSSPAVVVNYGHSFFVKTSDELYDEYLTARKEGAPQYELSNALKQADATKFESNKGALRRAKILRHVEPFLHSTNAEVMNMYAAGIASREEVYLKFNFESIISEFEKSKGLIETFGVLTTFNRTLERIKQDISDIVKKRLGEMPQSTIIEE